LTLVLRISTKENQRLRSSNFEFGLL